MGLLSRLKTKEQNRHPSLEEFDISKQNLDNLMDEFRQLHLESMTCYAMNWTRVKSPQSLAHERDNFERQLEILKRMKSESDRILVEAKKLVKFNSLSRKDNKKIDSQ